MDPQVLIKPQAGLLLMHYFLCKIKKKKHIVCQCFNRSFCSHFSVVSKHILTIAMWQGTLKKSLLRTQKNMSATDLKCSKLEIYLPQ